MKSPGEWVDDPRIDGLKKWFSRYQPFLITVLAIVLIAVFLPGRSQQTADNTASEISANEPQAAANLPKAEATAEAPSTVAGRVSVGGTGTAQQGVLTFDEAKKKGAKLVANCDTKTGRIQVPTRFAPPCTQAFVAPNAGKTWQGVDSKYIDVVYYQAQTDAASDTILTAAGANDSDAQEQQQMVDWGKYFQAHYNMWGREIRWHFMKGTGDASDDSAARADAIKIATQFKAFASLGAANNTMVNELKARGVMCMCTVSQPIEAYEKWYPYVWSTLMASTQGYLHRATYTARLINKPAQWAWDAINPTQKFQTKKRVFGFIWYETDDHAYGGGAAYFIKYMLDRYHVDLRKLNSSYLGYPNHTAENQDEARVIIQKFKQAGVTSILCSCDPFAPIFFTGEAKRQLYGPEWILTGSALTDTSFFARLYDQDEWAHAFGVSYLGARLPEVESEAMRLYKWQFNKTPSAPNSYQVLLAPPSIFFNGIHLAGPKLTPQTFAAGLESQPILGRGGITTVASSYGDKGVWPWKIDTLADDDATEIWWDRAAKGEDELGNSEKDGLYRYVNMGKRYFVSEWPKSTPFVFNKKNTITIYPKPPAADAWPCYPSPVTHKLDLC